MPAVGCKVVVHLRPGWNLYNLSNTFVLHSCPMISAPSQLSPQMTEKARYSLQHHSQWFLQSSLTEKLVGENLSISPQFKRVARSLTFSEVSAYSLFSGESLAFANILCVFSETCSSPHTLELLPWKGWESQSELAQLAGGPARAQAQGMHLASRLPPTSACLVFAPVKTLSYTWPSFHFPHHFQDHIYKHCIILLHLEMKMMRKWNQVFSHVWQSHSFFVSLLLKI